MEGDADDEKEVVDEGQEEEEEEEEDGNFETEEDVGREQDTEERNGFLDERQEEGSFESTEERVQQMQEDAEEEATEENALADEGQDEDGNFELEEGVKQEDGLVEDGKEEDGKFETEEGVQRQIFSGSEEFIGDLDGEDKFFQLATDYEYEEEELDDMEQEEKDRQYLEGCLNGMVYGESCCVEDEEEDSAALQNLDDLHHGKHCVAPAGSIVCCTQDKVDEDYKLDEDYIAPEIVQLGEELVRSDESDGEREEQVDPICRRTRARYSLTDMSLDQLETFLQGSDEEDDFQTMDDREEYEKFLRAVMEKDDESEKPEQSGRKEDEDDEEEDVDFEIEIEEALESDDASESVRRRKRKRPETREKRRQRAQFQSKRPLRQLLPHMGNFTNDVSKRNMLPETVNVSWPTYGKRRVPPVGEFTARQIGQLYCLMHEHVQLLLQVHSLCVWDPARQQIAKQTHGMLLELNKEREKVLYWKKTAFQDFCFRSPYTHPSTAEGSKRTSLLHSLSPPDPVQTSTSYGQNVPVPSNNTTFHPTLGHFPLLPPQAYPFPRNVELFNPRAQELLTSGPPNDRLMTVEWTPIVSGTVHSILDVAPLALVRDFLTDMAQAVQEYQQRYLEGGAGRFEREPLFAITVSSEQDQSIGRSFIEGTRSRLLGDVELMPPQIRKTMAAALVESTKKESISPVPKGVAIAVQRFLPFFNKAMFPHKAPPVATSSRLLFTEAEDELLAMGMMEFNHEWRLIQQRYLPSKTEHQVKIRAKNRSSTKAFANSIKAVHQFKTSPLTDLETKAIHEGLSYYKHDWDMIWRYCMPHRDPATLQRQYRTAIGTQKSYKTSETSKERRRLYEASRRKKIAALKKSSNPPAATEVVTEVTSTSLSCPVEKRAPAVASRPTITTAERQQRKLLPKKRKPKPQPNTSLSSSRPWLDSHTANAISNSGKQTVKLAPDLPFLKLPSHVQVLSQSQVQIQQTFPLAKRAVPVPVPVTSRWGQRTTQGLESPAFSIPTLYLQPLSLPNCAATEPTVPQQQGISRAHHLNVPSKVLVHGSGALVDFVQMMEGKKSSKTRNPVKKNKKVVCGTSKDTTNKNLGASKSASISKDSQQFRTFLEVGGISDPCTSHRNVKSRNTGRNRSRKIGKQPDPFVEEGSLEPLADQHIVMEQEELSDSEDEPDAGVEFEHEEMGDDSDKETGAEVLMTI